ncbi:MAG: tetratricopeptide repeat protein, partial [Chitinophagales bacterium]
VSKEEMYQLAYAQYQSEDYTNAIDNLIELNVIEDDSLGQNAMYVLGDCYLKTVQNELAKDAFFSASNTNHDIFVQEMAHFQYAKLCYELDYMNTAINSLTDYLEKYPQSAQANEAGGILSAALLETKNYAKAIEILETYNVSGPSVKKTYQSITLFRAIELFNDNQYVDAMAMLNKSLEQPVDNDLHGLATFLKANLFFEKEQYSDAISYFNQFLQFDIEDNSALSWANPALANYYTAYAYFKQKNYTQASTYFEQAISKLKSSTKENEQRILQDTYLRNADCLLMIKSYSKALTYYDKVINDNSRHTEYALVQKSVIYGLQGEYNSKIATLNNLKSQYPNSNYVDFALFELGNTYIEAGQKQQAINSFNTLINDHKGSKYIPEAWLKLGLTYFNSGNENQALTSYKRVVQDFPNSEEAKEALVALEDLYVYLGRPSDYIDFVQNQTGISISVSKQDSLMFQVAEEKYMQGDCAKAISALNEYLDLFPAGYFNLTAHYYRADCHYKAQNYTAAYPDYKSVLQKGLSKYYEKSLVKATYIAYEINGDVQEANYLYNDLYNSASVSSNRDIAIIGLMRTYFKLQSYNEVLNYANQVLDNSEMNEEVKTEALFYKAKSLFETKSYYQAEMAFATLVQDIEISQIKAEAAYHIAKIQYINGQYQVSLDNCFNLKNEYASYQYWVVKIFILMADNYVELDNLFQAKATLQSIVDNYRGDQALVDEARLKLDAVITQEQNETKIDLNTEEADTIQFEGE